MSPQHKRVLAGLSDRPLTLHGAAAHFGVPVRSAARTLDALLRRNLVTVDYRGRHEVWRPTERGLRRLQPTERSLP